MQVLSKHSVSTKVQSLWRWRERTVVEIVVILRLSSHALLGFFGLISTPRQASFGFKLIQRRPYYQRKVAVKITTHRPPNHDHRNNGRPPSQRALYNLVNPSAYFSPPRVSC